MSEAHRQQCSQRDVAVGWALHALEPEEEAGFARHLPLCDDCAERVRSTEAVAAVLGGGVEQLDPPLRLRAAILAAARTPQSGRVPVPAPRHLEVVGGARSEVPQPSRSPSRARRVLVAAAAVGLLAFGAGWAGNALVQPGSATGTQTALPELSSVRSTPLTGAASEETLAVVLTDGSTASVVPLGMTAAAAGQAYWLWGTAGADAAPVALGKVVVDSPEHAQVQLQGSVQPADFSGYALSVEPDTGVPVAPSTVIGSSGTI